MKRRPAKSPEINFVKKLLSMSEEKFRKKPETLVELKWFAKEEFYKTSHEYIKIFILQFLKTTGSCERLRLPREVLVYSETSTVFSTGSFQLHVLLNIRCISEPDNSNWTIFLRLLENHGALEREKSKKPLTERLPFSRIFWTDFCY